MVGIIILNYNGWDLSKKCIESIRETTKIKYKIYFVDNASNKKMPDDFNQLMNKRNDICFIQNYKNRGYSAGNNIGIKRAIEMKCNEILITNNDVIFKHNSIERMQNYIRSHADVGIVGPKVIRPNGCLQEINMGCKMSLCGKYLYLLRKTPFSFISKKFVDIFRAADTNKKRPFVVYGVSGCCFMMSKPCSRKMYPFDENTFLYEEENILSSKMEKLALLTVYYPQSCVIHLGGESTYPLSCFAYTCFVESEIYYCRKYLRSWRISILPLYIFRTLIFIKKFGLSDFHNYLKKTKVRMW